MFTEWNNAVIFCYNGSSEYWLSYSYSVDEYIWTIVHVLRIYHSHQLGTSATTAVPDPLTDPASLTVQLMSQSATTHHHNRPIHHIIHLTFSPSISPWSCLHFLRIWFSFHPLEIAPHRNNNGCTITWATIQPAAVCSFWWFSGRFCSIPMIEFCTTQNE